MSPQGFRVTLAVFLGASMGLGMVLLLTSRESRGIRLFKILRKPRRGESAWRQTLRRCRSACFGRIIGRGRRQAYERCLEQAVDTIGACLEAGQNLLQAFEAYSATGKKPLKDDFAEVLTEYQAGIPFSEALDNLASRVGTPEITYFVEALTVSDTQGGSLTSLLTALGDMVRERREWRREITAKSGEARWSAAALALMPPLMAVYLFLSHPDLMRPMFQDPTGRLALFYSVTSWLLGVVLVGYFVFQDPTA